MKNVKEYPKELKNLPEPRKTLIEALKVHDKEVPIANLLVDLFRNSEVFRSSETLDSSEPYRLNDLLLKCFLKTKVLDLIKGEPANSPIEYNFEHVGEIEGVDIEKKTDENKRIDIIIKTQNLVVCIEFKINHDLDNPLDDYKEHIEGNAEYKNKKQLFFVLSPNRKKAVGPANQKNSVFKLVILSQFIQTVKGEPRLNYPEYTNNFLNELIQTIDNRVVRHRRSCLLENLNKHKELENYRFHNNNKGGFLELKKENCAIKIRITKSCWSIEHWTDRKMTSNSVIEIEENYNNIKAMLRD